MAPRASVPGRRAASPLRRRVGGWGLPAVLLAAGLGLAPPPVPAASELLVFPQVTGYARDGAGAAGGGVRRELVPEVDLFAAGRRAAFRYLAELVLAEDEAELERLQLGWAPRPGLVLWAGRFHNPLDYWHSQYHHGDFLQPSITHPGIVAFEKDSGPLPQHLAGVMVQGSRARGDGALQYVVALAAGPEMGGGRLVPLSLERPGAGRHRPGLTLRLSRQWLGAGSAELGAFAGDYRIPFAGRAAGGVRLRVGGVYFNHEGPRHRVTGALFHVRNRVDDAGTRRGGAFQSGYLHGERALAGTWTAYGQWTATHDAARDPYLALLPGFVRQRATAGLRWDFTRRQALKLELSRVRPRDGVVNELAVQWSAAFP